MCGCSKNKNLKQMMSGSMLKTAEQLIDEGVAQWYKYTGPIATRLGHATGTRYSVNPDKCALLALEDYEWFSVNRPGMFTPCPVEMVSGKAGGSTEPKTTKRAKPVDINLDAITPKVEGDTEGATLEVEIGVSEDATLDLNESTDDLDAIDPDSEEGIDLEDIRTRSSIKDITAMTVNEALPVIREANTYTLNVWARQEKRRAGGERQMIMAAIAKRRDEIKVEAKG